MYKFCRKRILSTIRKVEEYGYGKKVSSCLEDNEKYMSDVLPDIIIGERKSSFYFIDGFTKDETMLKIATSIDMPEVRQNFTAVIILFDQLTNVLSGVTVCLPGLQLTAALLRSVEEPDKDKSLRGSRDGFVETIVLNTAMRRRCDPHLIMEMVEIGESSRSDVAI